MITESKPQVEVAEVPQIKPETGDERLKSLLTAELQTFNDRLKQLKNKTKITDREKLEEKTMIRQIEIISKQINKLERDAEKK